MQQIKVGIVGATGYGGVELVRLLAGHPHATVTAVSSVSFTGQKLSDVYPNLFGICDMVLEDEDAVIEKSDVIFAALPHGLCEALAAKTVAKGKKFIDLGADFRLDEADYKAWYGLDFSNKQLHEQARYCIPELHRDRLDQTVSIVANPGCYPTSIALGLAPLLQAGLAVLDTVIIDAKSGTTGAGRGLSQTTHHADCNEAFGPYKVAEHRHTPEIEQTLSDCAGKPVQVTFVPHLLPVNRGIVSTIYIGVSKGVTLEKLHALYTERYQAEPFVRVLPLGQTANLKTVKYTNLCDISLHLDERTGRAVIVSTIDNMVKGAAGQAIQNMNLLFDLDETIGLQLVPPAF